MTKHKAIHHSPIEVVVDDGSVALAGPDGAVVLLSPEAAEETSDRLWRGAMFAREQRRSKKEPKSDGREAPQIRRLIE